MHVIYTLVTFTIGLNDRHIYWYIIIMRFLTNIYIDMVVAISDKIDSQINSKNVSAVWLVVCKLCLFLSAVTGLETKKIRKVP